MGDTAAPSAAVLGDRIAVTVLGGYLGAGKTTLLNHLLRTATERIAVLVNDFGEINVDFDLIARRTDDTIELSNGCICCSMLDGFSEALDRIAALDPKPTRLVIEASGVADPATVAAYGHGPGLALDAVIVLVDAETIRDAVDDRYVGQTVRQQLAAADVLVVNKIDLVDADELAATVSWLGSQRPDAALVTTSESRVADELIFGRPGGAAVGAGPDAGHAGHGHSDHAPDHGAHDHDGHGHGHQTAETVFRSRIETFARPVERGEVERFMTDLPDTVVRAKGVVELAGEPDAHVVQRVGRRWSLRRRPDVDLDAAGPVVVIEVVAD